MTKPRRRGQPSPADQPKGEYSVGYARPPEHSKFKPGVSGNPKGRPKGTRNAATDILEMLKTPVEMKVRGKAKKVSTQFGALMRLREKALGGDHRALTSLLKLALQFNQATHDVDAEQPLTAADEEILAAFSAEVLANAGKRPQAKAGRNRTARPRGRAGTKTKRSTK